MKLLHLGDLHLGKSLGEFDLIDDQKFILEQILKLIDEKGADAVLIAGDVYDRSVPSEAATALLDDFLCKLSAKNVKTYMISGNHDSDERLNYGSKLFESNNIFISAKYNGKLERYDLGEDVSIWLLPFVKASHVRHFFPEAEIENYEDAVRTIIENAEIDENKCNILVAHQFVAGSVLRETNAATSSSDTPALAGSEGAAAQSVGLVEMIGYHVFDKFDYVALGHIHSPQRVGRDTVRYAGSPLKYSLSEANNDKSVPLITIENGKPVLELLPLTPLRDVRHIKGKLNDLLDPKNVTDPADYIYATLTDEEYANDVMGIFQQTYPNTVKIDYDNSRTRAIEHADISRIAENKSFSELIGDFYRMVYGVEISEEEASVMRDVAREAGVLNEAD